MTAAGPPFGHEEYRARLERVRRAMGSNGIEVLVVTDPANMAWLTGYDGHSFYVHQAVILPADGDPYWWGRAIDGSGARRTVWMADDRVTTYPEDYVQSAQHPHGHLAELLRSLGAGGSPIGVEMDAHYYSAAAHARLGEGLPKAFLLDATGLVNWERAVKSPAELGYMRSAARITERVMRRIHELVRPGARKNDLVAEIYHTAITGTEQSGGDYPAIVPLVATGPDGAAPHLTWGDGPLQEGASTFFEIAGCVRRYHAPLCRSVFLGDPPPEVLRVEQVILEGLEDGLEAARAGNRASDVAHGLFEVLRREGIDKEGRGGYPVGLAYPPDWGERSFSLRESDQTVLLPGMTFHLMAALWMDDWGLEISETVVIVESGPAEVLADFPRELLVLR